MFRRRRTAAALAAVVMAAGVVAAGPAAADTQDEQFAAAVKSLNIPFGPNVDVPEVGRGVCDLLDKGLASNVNPVPTVRGVITTLRNSGLERGQAVGLMRASVVVYCPQHGSVIGR
ncbi:DUF732 domain-containing protein [Mycobacterium sp. ACS4331]|uniref:DUF732 domain-containing protein n=1 Tax=Mycobacterium sp. ACS4331 TaxID=1834121 RepID=UPI0007FDF370|nr:DUF732 domain-containing protein [Mycobacterium sp. ACS4331]OBF26129.1 hypothetical protein A5727_03475 [Mycobacterium sp. ACS4331]